MDDENWKTRQPDGAEQTIGTLAALKEWASAGRIVKTDYVWNPIVQRWQLAADTIELTGIVGGVRGVSSQRHLFGCALAMLLFGVIGAVLFNPLIGGGVALIGLILLLLLSIGAMRSAFGRKRDASSE